LNKYKSKKYKKNCILFLIFFSLIYVFEVGFWRDNYIVNAKTYDKEELKQIMEGIYNSRSAALVSGDTSVLNQFFDVSQKYGQWALEHETKRVQYLKQWSSQRGIKFTNIESTVRIKKIYPKHNGVRMALEESYKFDYIYPQDEDASTNSFGVGIRHTVDLIKKDDKYLIYTDWYTDCFEDALSGFSGNTQSNTSYNSEESSLNEDYYVFEVNFNHHYNREQAVQYADKYCGAAWGSGNDFKYNKKYTDYNGIGGDCTNFASQVLGDKEAGGLMQDGGWHFSYSKNGNGAGSRAWVNADGFKDYLLYSGKGTVIKRGNFKELTTPTPEYPNGMVSRLDVGDLVCYAKKEDIDHFAVVTGFDRHGYPLVNSHTTDRYHVPWDLGWGDTRIKFYLIHIRD
jgi:hypothetical protein